MNIECAGVYRDRAQPDSGGGQCSGGGGTKIVVPTGRLGGVLPNVPVVIDLLEGSSEMSPRGLRGIVSSKMSPTPIF